MPDDAITGTSVDAIELLTAQHREVEQLWSQLQAAHGQDDPLQQDLAQRIITMLSQHDAIEVQHLYPDVREVSGGDELADPALDDHQEIRELLHAVDGKDVADPEVFATFGQAIQVVLDHVEQEEGEMFPRLRDQVGTERLTQLGERMQKALPMAPTHPHPSTPNNPVAAGIVGGAAAVVDKAKDAIKR